MDNLDITEGRQTELREVHVGRLVVVEAEGDGAATVKARVPNAADSINANNRVYPLKLMQREVKRMAASLDRRPGLVDHPERNARVRDIGVRWTSVQMEGKDVVLEGEIVPTAAGRDLEAIGRSGLEIGISSRGYGSGKVADWHGKEAMIIQDDYELVTYDVVVDPAFTEATVTVEEIEELDPALVRAIEEAVLEANLIDAKWTRAYVNDLPDSAFAAIESGGEEDSDGKTTPRALRHFPHHDDTGKVDPPHVRNALARLPNSKLPDDLKAKAQAHLEKHMKEIRGEDAEGKEAAVLEDPEPVAEVAEAATEEAATEEAAEVAGEEVQEAAEEAAETAEEAAEQAEEATEDTGEAADEAAAETEEASTEATEVAEEPTEEVAVVEDRIAALEGERALLADDVKNLKAIIDALVQEIKTKLGEKRFYTASVLSNFADMISWLHDAESAQAGESLVREVESTLSALAVHNLHDYIREKARPERFAEPIADTLMAACKTPEEVDEQFEHAKVQVEMRLAGTGRPEPKGVFTEEEEGEFDSLSPAQREQLATVRRYRQP